MVKLISIAFAIFLVASQQQTCTAIIDFVSSIIGVGQFINDMSKQLFLGPETADERSQLLDKIHDSTQYHFDKIMKVLGDVENIFGSEAKKNNLNTYIINNGKIFKEAVNSQLRLKEDGHRYPDYEYRALADRVKQMELELNQIYNLLTHHNTTGDIIKVYEESSQIYDNFCKTRMSYMQYLDNFLQTLKMTFGQFFIASKLSYDFLEMIGDSSYDQKKEDLYKDLKKDYKNAVRKFKEIMKSASREIWTCDSKGEQQAHLRYNHHKDYDILRSLDPKNRTGLDNIIPRMTFAAEFFAVYDSNTLARYKSIVPVDEAKDKYFCEKNSTYGIGPGTHMFLGVAGSNYGEVNFSLDQCNCICPDNEYYISTFPVVSNTAKNKVVTGAKLSMKNNTIFIQIQDGVLLANGSIDKHTLSWNPIDEDAGNDRNRVKITWDGIREVDLTETRLRNDRVLTGLQFKDNNSGRISLKVYSANFDFRSGALSLDWNNGFIPHVPDPAWSELDLANRDVPTRSSRPNRPDSISDQFLKFTISSSEKDGGQTTIPFIDTQKIETFPSTPVSGAGLIHRGQKGYGGFLALKLYTFNLYPYIEENI